MGNGLEGGLILIACCRRLCCGPGSKSETLEVEAVRLDEEDAVMATELPVAALKVSL